MPSIRAFIDETSRSAPVQELFKRINIPITSNSPPGLIQAEQEDPWSQAGQYSLGWVYFSIILVICTCIVRYFHMWTDKIRRALYKEDMAKTSKTSSPDSDFEMANLATNNSTARFFPREGTLPPKPRDQSSVSSIRPLNNAIAMLRWIFYRPIPSIRLGKLHISFPSAGVVFVVSAAVIFVTLYCFVPQPLYYSSIRFGSPPLAIRAGMIAVAMMPWIVALGMKANIVSLLTGLGHERLNVLHRWGGYICLFLSLIHTVPFYITPVSDPSARQVFQSYFNGQIYIYGTGIAALVPLLFLCIHSLPFLRRWMYELFVFLHIPVSIVFIGMLFWHCHNYLTSWNYLFATVAIWVLSYMTRLFYLNWTNPFRPSWLIGEEAAITLLPENAVKITIPTQVKWTPGQYVYLRMPGISIFENHPFTIASLCSDDFPSEYGENYRDMTLVFRPFGGFTRKVVNTALEKGPYHTYRAFVDGPFGGMQRELAAFDTVVLFAGGSGITAIVSHLLDLVKRMRDGRAVTKRVQLVWALKRPDTLEWFKEELRICREYAPPETVHCQFYITAAKRQQPNMSQPNNGHTSRPVSGIFHDKIDAALTGIASNRNSALIRDEAAGDAEKEKELRRENEDGITSLPMPYFPPPPNSKGSHLAPPPNVHLKNDGSDNKDFANGHRRQKPSFKLQIPPPEDPSKRQNFDFGFPSTPTMLQKNLMRFAFMPSIPNPKNHGWRTDYGRPDIPFMLRGFERDFGKRTCVFVCGPPSMRVDVQKCVARMQREVFSGNHAGREEVFLHTENYAI
ncbi:hypothetical protein MMC09_001888 [Bachmanniomyces sp. S44760]|nr:hypothetical protein [Bachmanniomyces sp. S44760]